MDAPREIRPEPLQQMAKMGTLMAVPMGLIFGFLGAVFGLVIGIPLGPCALVTALMGGVVLGFGGGALSGILFGGLMGVFMQSMLPEGRVPDDLEEGEVVQLFGPANHFRGIEGVGGVLALTNQRLLFVPHTINFQSGVTHWPRDQIRSARSGKSLGILHNRLFVEVSEGREETFVLELPDEWRAAIAGETP